MALEHGKQHLTQRLVSLYSFESYILTEPWKEHCDKCKIITYSLYTINGRYSDTHRSIFLYHKVKRRKIKKKQIKKNKKK